MPSLLKRLEEARYSWLEWAKLALPAVVVLALVLGLSWHFVRPAPPRRIVMATGLSGGVYDRVAQDYAAYFAVNGFELAARPSAGSIENYRLLMDPASGVDVALVQGGTLPSTAEAQRLRALASVYFEPLWVFYRSPETLTYLTQLAGKQLAIGPAGSGVRALAQKLLEENGIHQGNGRRFSDLTGQAAAEALRDGKLDAVLLVSGTDNPLLLQLLRTPGVKLMSFVNADAYARRLGYLSRVTLYQGSLDLAAQLPAQDTQLVAPAAMIVAKSEVHPSTVELLIQAARQTHSAGTLLNEPGVFPSANFVDLPLDRDAVYFLKNPPNFLHSSLPFWLASLIARLLILILPSLALLLPLLRLTPVVYRWRMRARIYRWYGQLRMLDARLPTHTSPDTLEADRQELAALERELARVKVPLSFMQELFTLRTHVTYLRERVEAAMAKG